MPRNPATLATAVSVPLDTPVSSSQGQNISLTPPPANQLRQLRMPAESNLERMDTDRSSEDESSNEKDASYRSTTGIHTGKHRRSQVRTRSQYSSEDEEARVRDDLARVPHESTLVPTIIARDRVMDSSLEHVRDPSPAYSMIRMAKDLPEISRKAGSSSRSRSQNVPQSHSVAMSSLMPPMRSPAGIRPSASTPGPLHSGSIMGTVQAGIMAQVNAYANSERDRVLGAFKKALFDSTQASMKIHISIMWRSIFGRLPTPEELRAVIVHSARATVKALDLPIDERERQGVSEEIIAAARESEARYNEIVSAVQPGASNKDLHATSTEMPQEQDTLDSGPSKKKRKTGSKRGGKSVG